MPTAAWGCLAVTPVLVKVYYGATSTRRPILQRSATSKEMGCLPFSSQTFPSTTTRHWPFHRNSDNDVGILLLIDNRTLCCAGEQHFPAQAVALGLTACRHNRDELATDIFQRPGRKAQHNTRAWCCCCLLLTESPLLPVRSGFHQVMPLIHSCITSCQCSNSMQLLPLQLHRVMHFFPMLTPNRQ